jgi:hypothetical protein
MKKRSTTNQVAGARTTDKITIKKVALTVKDGKHEHQQYLSVSSEHHFKRDVFGIARMLRRWQRNKRSLGAKVVLTLPTHQVGVRKSGDAHVMARTIRRALQHAMSVPA